MKKVLALVLTVVLVLTMSVSAFATDAELTAGNPNTNMIPGGNILHGIDSGLWMSPDYQEWADGLSHGNATNVGNPGNLNHTREQIQNAIAWELAQRSVVVSDISGIIRSMSDVQLAYLEANAGNYAAILTALGVSVAGDKWTSPLQSSLTEEFVTNAIEQFGTAIPAGMTVAYVPGSFAINKDWITATLTITNTETQAGMSKWARQTVTVNWCYSRPDYWNAGTKPPVAGTGTNEGTSGNPLGVQTGDNTVAVALVSVIAVAGVLAIAARKSRNVA